MTIILGIFIIFLTHVSAVEFPDSTTDDSFLLLTTTDTPVAATDNGMTLGEIPDQATEGNVVHDFEVTVDAKKLAETYPPLEIPENHKNYSFVSSIELPPLLNQFNAYQQQYKDYYKQKSEYVYKPIKFETNAASNHYVAQGLGAHLDDDARHRYEELKYERQPFPYTYEHERLPLLEQSLWVGHNEVQPVQNDISVHYYQPEEQVPTKKDVDHGWKKALKFFTALVPLGLLLATLTPSVISINSTVDQKPTRQRSLNEINLTGEDFREFFKGGNDPECDKKLICEVSTLGREENGTSVQKSFWYLANKIPDDVAEELGMREVFQSIRGGDCESFKCPKKKVETVSKRVMKRRRKKVAEA